MFRVFLIKTTWHWTLSSWFSRSGMVAFKIERSCPYSSGVPAWRVEGAPWWTSFPHFSVEIWNSHFHFIGYRAKGCLAFMCGSAFIPCLSLRWPEVPREKMRLCELSDWVQIKLCPQENKLFKRKWGLLCWNVITDWICRIAALWQLRVFQNLLVFFRIQESVVLRTAPHQLNS